MSFLCAASGNPSPYFWVFFPFLFVGGWCFVCFLISGVGGWGDLGRRFETKEVPKGRVLYGQSAQFRRFCNYNNCLTFIIAEEGFYLRVWPMFRLGHPSLLIPWEEIRNVKHGKILWVKKASFEVASPAMTRISVHEKVFDQFPKNETL